MRNKNGIEFVPTPRPRPDCTNNRTGLPKRAFGSQAAAEFYLRQHLGTHASVRIYQCGEGHYHFTRLRDAAQKSKSDHYETDEESAAAESLRLRIEHVVGESEAYGFDFGEGEA